MQTAEREGLFAAFVGVDQMTAERVAGAIWDAEATIRRAFVNRSDCIAYAKAVARGLVAVDANAAGGRIGNAKQSASAKASTARQSEAGGEGFLSDEELRQLADAERSVQTRLQREWRENHGGCRDEFPTFRIFAAYCRGTTRGGLN